MGKRVEIDTTDLDRQEAEADATAAALEADRTGAPTVALTFEQLKELVQAGRMSGEEIALIAGAAATKAKRPENDPAPGISVYSTPKGERDDPKGSLKCRMYFGGAPLERATLTPAEIAALNTLTPGAYRITKMDGSAATIEVKGQINANHQIDRLWILLPQGESPEAKLMYPPITSLASQCVDANRIAVVAA